MVSNAPWYRSRAVRALLAGTAAVVTGLGVAAELAPASAAAAPAIALADSAPASASAAGSAPASVLAGGSAPASMLAGALTPSDVQSAYRIPAQYTGTALAGGLRHPTVAVVAASGAPGAEADLAVYRARYGLPACVAATGCLTTIGQRGPAALPSASETSPAQIALALDAVSAACPQCDLLLVEADSADPSDLTAALATALARRPDAVTLDLGPGEPGSGEPESGRPGAASGGPTLDAVLAAARSRSALPIPVTVPSGDGGFRSPRAQAGAGTDWLAASASVTAVGGTTLTRTATGRWAERAWSGSGSGCAAAEPRPAWQAGVVPASACSGRAVADVSAVADPATGLASYAGTTGWTRAGGTALSASLVAAMYAMANANAVTVTRASTPTQWLYRYAAQHPRGGALYDVRTGSTGHCWAAAALCTAGRGWDGPTGLGSPRGLAAFTPTGSFAPVRTGGGVRIG